MSAEPKKGDLVKYAAIAGDTYDARITFVHPDGLVDLDAFGFCKGTVPLTRIARRLSPQERRVWFWPAA